MNSNVHVWLLSFFVYLFQSKKFDWFTPANNKSDWQIEKNKQKTTTIKRRHRLSHSAFGKVRFLEHMFVIISGRRKRASISSVTSRSPVTSTGEDMDLDEKQKSFLEKLHQETLGE